MFNHKIYDSNLFLVKRFFNVDSHKTIVQYLLFNIIILFRKVFNSFFTLEFLK